jgi:hypothetical protein
MLQIPRESILACSFSGMELNNRVSGSDKSQFKFIPLKGKNREFVLAECSPFIENLIKSKLGGANRLDGLNRIPENNFYLLFIQKFINWFYLPHVNESAILESSLSETYLEEIGISQAAKVCNVWLNNGDTILIKFIDEGMEYLFCHYYYLPS